jgi:hypothetical protein
MSRLSAYNRFGGVHPETAALANVLATQGEPISETLLLGIAGGLGIGYILWEFQEHHIKVLVLAFHHRWQYPVEHYENACKRLGLQYRIVETGSKKAAAQALDAALANGTPAVAWVDRASMPYLQLPDNMRGHLGHMVAVCGRDEDGYWIDDLAAQPFKVASDEFAEARARIGSYKNRLLLIEGFPSQLNLPAAVQQGIQVQIDHLSSDSESFSLPAIRKWARTMTDAKNKKGWLKVFEDRRGLYTTLSSIFEGIALDGAPGGLRGMYADFLQEAAGLLNKPALNEATAAYRALGEQWDALAQEALPDTVEPFKRAKALMCERHAIMMQGGEAWRSTAALTEQIRQIRSACNQQFPLDDAQISDLFAALQGRLENIYSAEVAALAALKAAMA